MKISKIYISAFGGLKDFSLDFCDGLQVISGKNEAGKTTVCEFIKAMFYGTGKRSSGQSMSIREKYTPWDGSPAGGRIYFEHSNREFFIEREFRKSDATDKIAITDIATGKSEACPPDIGKTLFGISVGAFERSMFIGNTPKVSSENGVSDEINQRLSNTAFTGGDRVSYANVLKRLDDARFALISKSGRSGSRIADISKRDSLLETLKETDLAAKNKLELLNSIKLIDEKLTENDKKCEEANRLLSRAKDIENAQKLKEYVELKENLDALTRELTLSDGMIADEMFLKKLDFGFSKLKNISEKTENDKAELKSLENAAKAREGLTTDQIRKQLESAKTEKLSAEQKAVETEKKISSLQEETESLMKESIKAKGAKRATNPALLASGLLAIISGLVLYFTLNNIFLTAGISGLGILCTLLSFFIRPVDKTAFSKAEQKLREAQIDLSATKSELMVLKSEIGNLDLKIQSLNVSLSFGVNEQQRILEVQNRITEGEKAAQTEKLKFLSFFGLSDDTDLSALKSRAEALYEKAESQKQIKLRLSYLSRDLGAISYEEAIERLKTASEDLGFDLEEQKIEASRLLSEKSELREKKARLETELKTGYRNIADPEDLRREIKLYDERINAKKEYFDAATIAREVLEESLISARKSFGGALENETLNILKEITGNAYSFITVSDEFDMTAQKSGTFGAHEIEYLSRGAKDQAYLALRLAISKLLTEKEPLPIILDDSLSQYDDNRFDLAINFLKNYSADRQILLFTCHNFVANAAVQTGIKVIAI